MSDVVIRIENLGKSYKIGKKKTESYTALRDIIAEKSKKAFQYIRNGQLFNPQREQSEVFWALKNINLDIKRGEIIGIIGRNGAGKSTLLKILSRITPPTEGRVKIKGRIASLLEVGTGFHPELTGRENIYLSGAVLGMKRDEIKRKFDEIVAFSGIEQFLETPVKRYSSGMYVRLGFAIAAHLEPEILLVDEVLAVGDAEFQKKCLGKMGDVAKEGRTVLFVSHNMGAVRQLCKKGIVIEFGQILNHSSIHTAIDFYNNTIINGVNFEKIRIQGPLKEFVHLKECKINNINISNNNFIQISSFDSISIHIKFDIKKLMFIRINFAVYKDGIRIFTLQDSRKPIKSIGTIQSEFQIPAKLLRPGTYTIGAGGIESERNSKWFWLRDFGGFEILEEWHQEIEFVNHGIINVFSDNERI